MKKMQRTVNLNGWVEIPVELRRALKIRGGLRFDSSVSRMGSPSIRVSEMWWIAIAEF